MERISIEGFSVHGLLNAGMIDLFGYLEACGQRYHVAGAGIWNGLFASTEPDYIAKVQQALDERCLAVPNIAFDGCSVWADDAAVRSEQRAKALRNIAIAAELGADTVRIDWGVTAPSLNDEQFAHIVASYREYCDLAAKHGMRLGAENHFGASLDPELQLQVLEAVDHQHYGVLLHFGHWSRLAEQGDAMLAPHAMHTHIPADVIGEDLETCCRTLRALMDAGYRGYWGVEHHTARHEYVQLEWQVALVRRCLAFVAEGEVPITRNRVVNKLLVELKGDAQ
ncbi:MAG: TIM barrel protein [Planctomycetota bacterium]|jgi:hypothetical protein|nr:TIM barrel protein [Planctomycetota bacterium]